MTFEEKQEVVNTIISGAKAQYYFPCFVFGGTVYTIEEAEKAMYENMEDDIANDGLTVEQYITRQLDCVSTIANDYCEGIEAVLDVQPCSDLGVGNYVKQKIREAIEAVRDGEKELCTFEEEDCYLHSGNYIKIGFTYRVKNKRVSKDTFGFSNETLVVETEYDGDVHIYSRENGKDEKIVLGYWMDELKAVAPEKPTIDSVYGVDQVANWILEDRSECTWFHRLSGDVHLYALDDDDDIERARKDPSLSEFTDEDDLRCCVENAVRDEAWICIKLN